MLTERGQEFFCDKLIWCVSITLLSISFQFLCYFVVVFLGEILDSSLYPIKTILGPGQEKKASCREAKGGWEESSSGSQEIIRTLLKCEIRLASEKCEVFLNVLTYSDSFRFV